MTGALKVAVDLVYFTGRKGGTESYARELFPALGKDPGLRFVGIASKELRGQVVDWFPGEMVHLPVSGESRVQWAAAVAFALGPRARALHADLLHCPANFGPVVRALPTVVTVHDLLPLRHPEWVPGGRAAAVRWLSRRTIAAADRIIADSEATASDIRQLTGRVSHDIDVVMLGAPTPPLVRRAALPARPFVLSGGNRMPHKNFERLIEAWTLIPEAERPRLLITGSHGDDPLRDVVRRCRLEDDVELLGWVSGDELAGLYSSASAYVFPTMFEGFGLPVLEAMAAGCPVIGSDLPVLREVGGDAMVYFEPTSPVGIANAVRQVVGDHDQQRELQAAGHLRVQQLTWEQTASRTADVYRRLARR
ncbi:glycosyltransferase family 4 protein [Nocardioides sp. GCM10030258]|uniref:glycosyltransferase family 4 protein n=1 Tax=unclassified Nocardioides TaxID=2615069 RepID=UPI003619CAE3